MEAGAQVAMNRGPCAYPITWAHAHAQSHISPVGICTQSCPHRYTQADNHRDGAGTQTAFSHYTKPDPGSLNSVAKVLLWGLQRETLLRFLFLLKSHFQLMPSSHTLPPPCVVCLCRVAGLPLLPHWCAHLRSDPHQNFSLGAPRG